MLFLPAFSWADVWTLGDWSANIDGSTYNPPALPASVDTSGFAFDTGLGTLKFTFDASLAHYAGVYLYLYDDNGFGDNSSAYANPSGAAPSDVTFQLGWPGVGSPTVFDNFAANALDGSNTVPAYSPPPDACCSVALAMIRALPAHAGFVEIIGFTVDTNAPSSGFYLQETDHDTGNSVYLSQFTEETPIGPGTVPEPGAIWLLLTASIGVACATRRHRAQR